MMNCSTVIEKFGCNGQRVCIGNNRCSLAPVVHKLIILIKWLAKSCFSCT